MVFDVFSKRNKPLPDVYTYDQIPAKLRRQVCLVLAPAIGHRNYHTWKMIEDVIKREHGLFMLGDNKWDEIQMSRYLNHILKSDTEQCIDCIELAVRAVDQVVRDDYNWKPFREDKQIEEDPDHAIREINRRFLENGIGFQYEDGVMIRLDSEFTHSEIIRPALSLLGSKNYKGAHQEFLQAHSYYRKQDYKSCTVEALKAFESTMKAILSMRKVKVPANATSKALLDLIFQNGIVPAYLQSQFTGLRSVLEAGVPTVRNKTSGHGQGSAVQNLPESLAQFALNQTAVNIVFLINSHLGK